MQEVSLRTVLVRLAEWLDRSGGPVDVSEFVRSFGLNDIQAGQQLMRAFDAHLVRGRLTTNLVEFDGHISRFPDDTRLIGH